MTPSQIVALASLLALWSLVRLALVWRQGRFRRSLRLTLLTALCWGAAGLVLWKAQANDPVVNFLRLAPLTQAQSMDFSNTQRLAQIAGRSPSDLEFGARLAQLQKICRQPVDQVAGLVLQLHRLVTQEFRWPVEVMRIMDELLAAQRNASRMTCAQTGAAIVPLLRP